MIRRTRIPYVLSLLAVLGAVYAGCRSEESTEPPKPVTLDISSTSLKLSPVDSLKEASMTLSCGCGFLLDSIRFAGDTSVIHFTPSDSLVVSRHTHRIAAWYDPAASIPGPHTAEIEFTVFHTYKGVSYVYVDTVRAVVE